MDGPSFTLGLKPPQEIGVPPFPGALLVLEISAVKQPCLNQKIQCLFSKYLCIF